MEQLSTVKQHKRQEALTTIVESMCEHGFMNGWCGDVSKEFQDNQIYLLVNLSERERKEWIKRNKFNLVTYCKLTELLLNEAL